jgi:hypothetical protein
MTGRFWMKTVPTLIVVAMVSISLCASPVARESALKPLRYPQACGMSN